MNHFYFGLICSSCGARYPLGEEIHRDLKYQLDRGPFELTCVHCGVTGRYPEMSVWEHPDGYPPAVMAVARTRVRRARQA